MEPVGFRAILDSADSAIRVEVRGSLVKELRREHAETVNGKPLAGVIGLLLEAGGAHAPRSRGAANEMA
jgi:hypothetical protein